MKSLFINKMDLIINTDGFFHILEEIFMNLEHEDLLKCQNVNNAIWKKAFSQPKLWLKKCVRKKLLSKHHEIQWRQLIKPR